MNRRASATRPATRRWPRQLPSSSPRTSRAGGGPSHGPWRWGSVRCARTSVRTSLSTCWVVSRSGSPSALRAGGATPEIAPGALRIERDAELVAQLLAQQPPRIQLHRPLQLVDECDVRPAGEVEVVGHAPVREHVVEAARVPG